MEDYKSSILVIEDDVNLQKVLKLTLSKYFATIHLATNGKEALDLFSQVSPDIVITDINMPELNGIDFIRHIRSKGINCPIIVMSGNNDSSNMIGAMRLGVCDFLIKPFLVNDLLKSVYRVIEIDIRQNKINDLEQTSGDHSIEIARQKKFVGLLRTLSSYSS